MKITSEIALGLAALCVAFAPGCGDSGASSPDEGSGNESGSSNPGGAGGTSVKGGTGGTDSAGGQVSSGMGGANSSGAAGGAGGSGAGGKAGAGGSSAGAAGSNGRSDAGVVIMGCGDGGVMGGGGPVGTPPVLTPGVWKDITPAGADLANTFGANSIDLDPKNPFTLYASIDQRGIWKSTDGGSTWTRLGDPNKKGNTTSSYLDSPLRVAVDPCDSNHLYATQGVRGSTLGFWVSRDGGATWAWPKGFVDIAKTTTNDVTTLAVDPSNFAHILVGSHSPWMGQATAGIVESKDGGETFAPSKPASGGFQAGSVGIGFAFDPAAGIGNSNTWVLNGDGTGTWRTTDGGANWTKVSELSGVHGGADLYRDSKGTLYFGGYQYPYRSTDNGATWTQLGNGGLSYAYYLSMVGDGKNLYTAPSCACGGAPYNQAYFTSLETDGLKWTAYQGGAQKVGNGPYRMRFDKVNRIVYSANWDSGVWALRVID